MIDIDALGTLPRSEANDERFTPILEAMDDAVDDHSSLVVYARQALEIDPACASALLVIAEHAETRAERIALLKEVLSIGKREFGATRRDVAWWWQPGTRTVMVGLGRTRR